MWLISDSVTSGKDHLIPAPSPFQFPIPLRTTFITHGNLSHALLLNPLMWPDASRCLTRTWVLRGQELECCCGAHIEPTSAREEWPASSSILFLQFPCLLAFPHCFRSSGQRQAEWKDPLQLLSTKGVKGKIVFQKTENSSLYRVILIILLNLIQDH